jgi:hypothetical protein
MGHYTTEYYTSRQSARRRYVAFFLDVIVVDLQPPQKTSQLRSNVKRMASHNNPTLSNCRSQPRGCLGSDGVPPFGAVVGGGVGDRERAKQRPCTERFCWCKDFLRTLERSGA